MASLPWKQATKTPMPQSAKQRLGDLAETEWEEEANSRKTEAAPSQDELQTNCAHFGEAQPTTPEDEQETTRGSLKPKRRRLDRKDGRRLVKDTTPCVEDRTITQRPLRH